MMLVSLQQASEHIRRDTDADDLDLKLKVQAASAMVLNYIAESADDFMDTSGDITINADGEPVNIPFEVQAAVLMLVEILYSERGNSEAFSSNYLPQPIVSILYPLRRPTAL